MNIRLNTLEIFLIQVVCYSLLWFMNEYVASYLCLILPVVIGVILVLSWIADLIEPARIGRKYYRVMAVSVLAPVVVGAFFYFLMDGELAWMHETF